MVRRAVPRSDLDAVRGSERIGDVTLGRAHGLVQGKPLGETGGDRRGQRAAGAVGVLGGDAVGRKAREGTWPDQQIGALWAAAVAALDQHRLRTQREQTL